MGKCCQCGAETPLYVNSVPICLKCSDERDKKTADLLSPKLAASAKAGAGEPEPE